MEIRGLLDAYRDGKRFDYPDGTWAQLRSFSTSEAMAARERLEAEAYARLGLDLEAGKLPMDASVQLMADVAAVAVVVAYGGMRLDGQEMAVTPENTALLLKLPPIRSRWFASAASIDKLEKAMEESAKGNSSAPSSPN